MPKSDSTAIFGAADRFLLSLDEGTFGALYRVMIGFATIPAMHILFGTEGSDWNLVAFLLLVLLLLRTGLAVGRKLLPFSAELKEAWSVRRRTAKTYDSYQWRKLMWIGIGLALYVAVSGRYWPIQIALASFCVLAGAAGMMRWHVVMTDNSTYPKPRPKKIKRPA